MLLIYYKVQTGADLMNSSARQKSERILILCGKRSVAYGALMYCSMERSFSLTEQLVDICLFDESDNDSLLRNEDDQPKIIAGRFFTDPFHITMSLSKCVIRWPGKKNMAKTI